MSRDFITTGYLDVKILAKVKRGFTPWKAWRKQWCEIKRLDNIDYGLEIILRNTLESSSTNGFVIPRDATLCRTESRSKQFSFGIFGTDRCHKPLLFLSGVSETESQLWMMSIRGMLALASQIKVSPGSFYVSLVDNNHSRTAGLTGIHGILRTSTRDVVIKDPTSDETRLSLQWYQLHQFHLAATGVVEDEKKICVLHTSKEFRSGPGQLYFFCLEAPQLLQCLVARGKIPRIFVNSFLASRRFSRSEGDLRESENSSGPIESPTSPVCLRSHSGSEDSGVRISMASDDSNLIFKCKKAASLLSMGFGMLVAATPGGSEIDSESVSELLDNEEECPTADLITTGRRFTDPRRESGVSVISGVYEEIPDTSPVPKDSNKEPLFSHHYEDPIDVILGSVKNFTPPPLPPRRELLIQSSEESVEEMVASTSKSTKGAMKSRTLSSNSSVDSTNTLISISESTYMVMTPSKSQTENVYVPMNPLQPSTSDETTYMNLGNKESSQ